MTLKLELLPPPKRVRPLKGKTSSTRVMRRIVDIGLKQADAYRLTIDQAGALLEAAGETGLFYAQQTLAQLRAQFPKSLPCLAIVDWPDYPVRGFYHDVTRGKVPTLRTLLGLAETCARYKINHLELYVEHTYAFKRHPEVWRGADPLTRDEILALDARCAELHIDLVPSFSTFGHFYTWIRNKFPELNELGVEASRKPYSWQDRLSHYTLDCQNPRSIALVREIIQEVRPLFRSRFFNVCADETFDLGCGRNKELAEKIGKGRLYLEFLKKIMGAVREAGAVPLFWGDIIGHHPELFPEVPKDAIALDWDYAIRPDGSRSKMMHDAGCTFYVCPGTSGWEGWLPDFQQGYLNITRFARAGLKYGACGLLNTDWGDFGHINTLGLSLPGLAIGASSAWHVRSGALSRARFDETISKTIFGDATGRIMCLLTTYASLRKAAWLMLCWFYQSHAATDPEGQFQVDAGLPGPIFQRKISVHETALKKMRLLAPRIERLLARCRPADALLVAEVRLGLLGQQVMEEVFLNYFHRTGRGGRMRVDSRDTVRRLGEVKRQLRQVWKKRNKPSELYRIEEVLDAAARDVEKHPAAG